MRQHSRIGTKFLALTTLVAALSGVSAYAAPPAPCSSRLVVELTPDVPNPSDQSFLSSLLGNQLAYQLTWIGEAGSFAIVLDLNGPGPEEQCQAVIASIRKDGRVLSVRSDPDETQSVSITAQAAPIDAESSIHLSHAGLGSLYWAALHPGRAWQIALPVEADDPARAYSDLGAACRALQESPDDPPACP